MASTATDSAVTQKQKLSVPSTKRVGGGLLDPGMLLRSTPDAFRKLDPRTLWRNPVMFIVEIGAAWSTVLAVIHSTWFAWLVVFWLWLTVLFANIAEAVAEGRGKAQAETLRRAKTDMMARRLTGWAPGDTGTEEEVAAPLLQQGDIVVVEAGQTVPGDGDVVEGIASVDESAITGESAPVIRESGGDRSAVTGGTTVLSDRIVVKITQKPGESFIDRMIALVEGANRQKTPNEIALNILLAALTIIFVFAVATLQPLAIYSKANSPGVPDTQALTGYGVTGIVMVALLVCLIPTTIGALLSAIGIAGMDRLVQRNVLAMSGRAVEAAGDVNTLAARQDRHDHARQPAGSRVHPASGRDAGGARRRGAAVQPRRRNTRGPFDRGVRQAGIRPARPHTGRARTRAVGGVQRDDPDVRGRPARTATCCARAQPARLPTGYGPRGASSRPNSATIVDGISASGGTPLVVGQVVGEKASVLGVIHLKDVVKQGMRRTIRRDAQDGHPHRDDHRRQPVDRQGDRRRGRCRRLPRRGHARGQDGADQA